ncbi:MAG: hypothetical protein NTZ83_05925 [Candidatus Pacearchaeota archaeon]|nr:hypothetical protein [Candidatus Pacearchaeota archaeon]
MNKINSMTKIPQRISQPRESEEIKLSMTEEKIADWINRLIRLKNKKELVILDIDEYLTLHLKYEKGENE